MLNQFEKNVLAGFEKAVSDNKTFDWKSATIGAAVSGGADSTALLHSLCRIFPEKIFVITVNHFIRPENETCGDVDFVRDECDFLKKQGFGVELCEVQLEKNAVKKLSEERKLGIEEAARFLRYEAFDKICSEKKIDYLCLAHSYNDQLETLLMRFLQGASCDSSGGIPACRGRFVRPMLDISRPEIECYLKALGRSWRTDSTNFDNSYLRNRIRNKLVPFLNEEFDGWQKAVAAGGEKALEDRECISLMVEKIPVFEREGVHYVRAEDFFSSGKAVQKRLLLKLADGEGANIRIPDKFLNDVIRAFSSCDCGEIRKFACGFDFIRKKDKVCVKKCNLNISDFSFFDIIEEEGVFEYDFGSLKAFYGKDGFIRISVSFSEEYADLMNLKNLSGKTKELVSGKDKKRLPCYVRF